MDWTLAIERNRAALLRIVSALFAMIAASRFHGAGLMVPRRVWLAVLLVLRPAEAAVRRLVLLAVRDLAPLSFKPRTAPFTSFTCAAIARESVFGLIDPLRDSVSPAEAVEFSWGAHPENTVDAFPPAPDSQIDVPQDAAHIHNRLRALRHALADLQKQARRVARWNARRDLMLRGDLPTKNLRTSPIRPGLPPGWRARPAHEIDDVLRECHCLARDSLNAPNTY